MNLAELGIQKRQLNAFAKKNLYTTDDLAMYAPRSYHDYRTLYLVKKAPADRFCAFGGVLVYCDIRSSSAKYLVIRILQDDGTNVVSTMFTNTYRYEYIVNMRGQRVVICGRAFYDEAHGWSIRNADDVVPENEFRTGIFPVYGKIKGISDQYLTKCINQSIGCVREPLAQEILSKMNLMPYPEAVRELHAPSTPAFLNRARQRLKINDMMYFSEALGKAEAHGTDTSSILMPKSEAMEALIDRLPYHMTTDQRSIVDRFLETVRSGKRFNALIQGDVGCGKTVIAITMMACAYENGYQSALMAPREVLAIQHYEEVKKTVPEIPCIFLSSSMTAKEKKAAIQSIASGEIGIVVGTHSCIADAVEYHKLGLTITDEEHLFGVRQKEMLEVKADEGVHSVSMSATPIPRSLATVLYGSRKQVLTIHTMPAGRVPVQTAAQSGHTQTFRFMEQQIRAGHQCYVVCPAIEKNEEYDITSVEEVEKAYRAYFEPKKIRIGIVHGKIPTDEVRETIRRFSEQELDILISTTVIEVGVNVPNATVMVVEQSERFGLASLHQLRGRVGRSSFQSYCILMARDKENPRIKAMLETTDGFKIAEADLAQRGSGDLLGERQAGNNRFVNEMLDNPVLFQIASNAVEYAAKNGYTNHLDELYGEHAERMGEEET